MKKNSGFTLIELLLVVAIVLTLSVLSASFYARFLVQNAVENTTEQLVGSFRKAQIYSMEGKRGSGWAVNYSTDTITLYKGTDFLDRDTSFDEKFSVNPNVTVAGLSNISFAQVTGLPTPQSASVTISGNGNSKTVTLNSQGVVSR
ncbi:MAG: type II secretion system protein [bacterium]|nr:type II secretion system protein [bacterium]